MKKLILFVSILFLVSCTQQKVDKKAEGEKIMQLSKEWSKVASEGNVGKTVTYWADDAVVISAGQPVLNGKQAIQKMVEESYRMPGFRISWQPQSVEVSESGDMAYLLENSQISFTDSTGHPVIIHNKAVSIWRKQADGSWKNVVDISTPAAQQK
jgi:uncharacterized protein (TIGR02246 family)